MSKGYIQHIMTNSIVIELQELASNSNNDISELLRKTLLVSTKLQLAAFRNWTLSELNGYKGESTNSLPDYRITSGELKAFNPVRGWIPLEVPHQIHEKLTQIRITESVNSLEQLIANAQGGILRFDFSARQAEHLMSMQEDYLRFRPTRFIGVNRLTAILGAVRTTILEWSLKLEADGILGENLSFSIKEKRSAMNNINIQNFQGVLGNLDRGSSVNQENFQEISAHDFSDLSGYLAKNGIDDNDIEILKLAIAKDPKRISDAQFGPKVSEWIGKMVGKAASGGWEISVATAGGVLANALSKFYGLS